jgi:hypothetical protein
MILIGFLSFAVFVILAFSFLYSDKIKDRIKTNQVEGFAANLINSAESVFFAGEPSRTTVRLYLPDGVESITILSDSIVIETRVSGGGRNVRAYESSVPLNGTILPGEGTRKLILEAKSNFVDIYQAP